MITTVPLNKLKFGDDKPGGGFNARSSNRKDGLDELGASLLSHGIIQPLTIEPGDKGVAYVVDGNRRLAALRKLVNDGKIAKDYPVKTAELDAGTGALEASLAANIMRLPMHEIDQYEAFARLVESGLAVPDIASRFGASDLVVRRRLALGKLSPTIRAAWRDGKVPVDAAQAFTIVDDHELQDKTYKALAQGQNLYRSGVIRALTGNEDSWRNRRYLALVGRTAFEAAGGRIATDLFETDAPKVLDGALLATLARDRVAAKCTELTEAGWLWAMWDVDAPNDRYRWDRLESELIDFTPEERETHELLVARAGGAAPDGSKLSSAATYAAENELRRFLVQPSFRSFPLYLKCQSGCLVSINDEGKFEIDFGRVRLEAAPPAPRPGEVSPAPGATVAETVPEKGISAALAQTLSEQKTIAVAGALSGDATLALRLVVATLQARSGSPARLSVSGFAGLHGLEGIGSQTFLKSPPSFKEAFDLTEGSSEVSLLDELAALVAASLDLTETARLRDSIQVTGIDDLVDAIEPSIYLEEALQAFDPEAYFDRASAKMAIAAIVEMKGRNTCISSKKADLMEHASALARDHGWLPPQLRSSHFTMRQLPGDGPSPAAPVKSRKQGTKAQ